MNDRPLFLSLAASLVLSGLSLSAQRDPAAGFGAESLRLALDPITGVSSNLVVQHLGSEIFVTDRNFNLQTGARHPSTCSMRPETYSAVGLSPAWWQQRATRAAFAMERPMV